MTRDDIISELQDTFVKRGGEVLRRAIFEIAKRDHQIAMLHKEIEELRAAVLAEREECARVCEQPYDEIQITDDISQRIYKDAFECAEAIRARGET